MSDFKKIPVFTLPIVLLPGEPLPLHLFEPKYLRMLDYLIEEQKAGRDAQFGVLTSVDGNVANVGCMAQLVQVIERAPDGRAVILTFGTRPFEFISMLDGDPYPSASIHFAEQEPLEDFSVSDEALDLFRELAAESAEVSAQHEELDDGAELVQPAGGVGLLSYRLAVSLNLPIAEKLALLEKHSEKDRLGRLIEIMNFDLTAREFSGQAPDVVQ